MALTQVQGQMLSGSNNTTTTIQSNGTTAITIDSSQNVGIGTSSPACRLDVNRGSAGLLANFTDGVNTNFQIGTTSLLATIGPSAGSTAMAFKTGDTERMRIDSSGNLLVGNTSPSFSTVAGIYLSPQGRVLGTCTNDASGAFSRLGSDGAVVAFYRSTALVGTISVTASATAYNTSSDYRLKENVAPMTGALDVVQQLKPVTYNWKVDGSNGQGFIAHELAEVVPDCVTGEKDAVETYTDEDGNEQTRPKYQGIDTSFLVATLTAAIQELKAIVDTQATKIAELEAKLSTK